jgi:hypothetical protein
MRKINLNSKRLASAIISAPRKSADADTAVPNMMLDPRYLRQSAALIQEALQKGFDVLQLASGEIITTGTKTIVHQYGWDDTKGKLVKHKSDARKAKNSSEDIDESEENEDA